MKGKNLQPRSLYPARISFRFDREIKTFTDKQKLREFSTTKPALKQMLGFPGGAVVENAPANAGGMGLTPGRRRSCMPRDGPKK